MTELSTSGIRVRRYVFAFLVALIVVFCSVWIQSLSQQKVTSSGQGSNLVDTGETDFVLSGLLADPLRPGVSSGIDLTLSNTTGHALTVKQLTISVVAVDAPQSSDEFPCSPSDFDVQQTSVTAALAAHRVATLSQLGIAPQDLPRVAMLNTSSNQDGCINASLSLSYHAVGEESR
ncbi:hypothetical protein [Lacisediminihabitans sp. H27-G8]|uniref:hypothetical protein n=1 Tax=Lacisediminihabitans sp. H27-G8 TaxID=3111909 RepID=UPI0038FC8B7A